MNLEASSKTTSLLVSSNRHHENNRYHSSSSGVPNLCREDTAILQTALAMIILRQRYFTALSGTDQYHHHANTINQKGLVNNNPTKKQQQQRENHCGIVTNRTTTATTSTRPGVVTVLPLLFDNLTNDHPSSSSISRSSYVPDNNSNNDNDQLDQNTHTNQQQQKTKPKKKEYWKVHLQHLLQLIYKKEQQQQSFVESSSSNIQQQQQQIQSLYLHFVYQFEQLIQLGYTATNTNQATTYNNHTSSSGNSVSIVSIQDWVQQLLTMSIGSETTATSTSTTTGTTNRTCNGTTSTISALGESSSVHNLQCQQIWYTIWNHIISLMITIQQQKQQVSSLSSTIQNNEQTLLVDSSRCEYHSNKYDSILLPVLYRLIVSNCDNIKTGNSNSINANMVDRNLHNYMNRAATATKLQKIHYFNLFEHLIFASTRNISLNSDSNNDNIISKYDDVDATMQRRRQQFRDNRICDRNMQQDDTDRDIEARVPMDTFPTRASKHHSMSSVQFEQPQQKKQRSLHHPIIDGKDDVKISKMGIDNGKNINDLSIGVVTPATVHPPLSQHNDSDSKNDNNIDCSVKNYFDVSNSCNDIVLNSSSWYSISDMANEYYRCYFLDSNNCNNNNSASTTNNGDINSNNHTNGVTDDLCETFLLRHGFVTISERFMNI